MEIVIKKSEVFREVEKQSLLMGSSLGDRNNDFEKIWATEYEGCFLDSFWIEGVTAAVLLFKRYIKDDTVTHDLSTYNKDEILSINAVMPTRFSEHLKGSVTSSLKMMIASNILYRWLLVKLPEASEKYKTHADDYVKDLIQKLSYRTEPSARKLDVATSDDNLGLASDEYYRSIVGEDVLLNEGSEAYCRTDAEDIPLNEEMEGGEFFRRNIHDYIKFNQNERSNDCPQSRRDNG